MHVRVATSLASAKTLAWQMGAESRARIFLKFCAKEGIPEPEREYHFCERRWRFDFAWPDHWLALESNGGRWQGGKQRRHGPVDDEKRNEAQLLGWTVLTVSSDELNDLSTIALVKRGLGETAITLTDVEG